MKSNLSIELKNSIHKKIHIIYFLFIAYNSQQRYWDNALLTHSVSVSCVQLNIVCAPRSLCSSILTSITSTSYPFPAATKLGHNCDHLLDNNLYMELTSVVTSHIPQSLSAFSRGTHSKSKNSNLPQVILISIFTFHITQGIMHCQTEFLLCWRQALIS